MQKKGVLLAAFGGPENTKDVPAFLFKLFSDPAVLVDIPAPLRLMLATLITLVKSKSSMKTYDLIGGGSPQKKWTQMQRQHFESSLRQNVHKVTIGFLLSKPSFEEALKQLDDCDEIQVIPLFPQFSTTTSGSCFSTLEKARKKLNYRKPIRIIRDWSDFEPYLDLQAAILLESYQELKLEERPKLHVLFSAHSLPLKIVQKGDDYPNSVQKTFKGVTERLHHLWKSRQDLSYSLAFQSRNGPIPWIKPYVEEEIPRLGKIGVKNIFVIPLSFVCDHIETLYEIDILYSELAQKNLISLFRSRCFNDDPRFGKVLTQLLDQPNDWLHPPKLS